MLERLTNKYILIRSKCWFHWAKYCSVLVFQLQQVWSCLLSYWSYADNHLGVVFWVAGLTLATNLELPPDLLVLRWQPLWHLLLSCWSYSGNQLGVVFWVIDPTLTTSLESSSDKLMYIWNYLSILSFLFTDWFAWNTIAGLSRRRRSWLLQHSLCLF